MAQGIPDKNELVSLVLNNVPKELLEEPIWLAYYFKRNDDGTFTKPPVKGYNVRPETPGKTFSEVIKDGYPGIKMDQTKSLIAFDIDDKDAKLGKRPFDLANLSSEFLSFMNKYPSYTEISPSGCGLRVLLNIEDKDQLPGRANLNKDFCIGGEFYANSGYVTITGNKTHGENILAVKPEDIKRFITSNGNNKETTSKASVTKGIKSKLSPDKAVLPKLSLVLEALSACSLDQNSAVQRAYRTITGQDYSHYDFWLKILSACHHYSLLTNPENSQKVLAYVLDWSSTDPTSFNGEDDVITHWASFSEGDDQAQVTYHTLFKFARLVKFVWPKEKYEKGKPTGKPLINEIQNFHYLLKYYELEFFLEPYTNSYYISGDSSALAKYFKDEETNYFFQKLGPYSIEKLSYKMWALMQDNHYDNITYSVVNPLVKTALPNRGNFNILEQWLNSSYEDLPEELKEPGTEPSLSNLKYLMSCIEFDRLQNLSLAERYLKAFFFGMVMPVYNVDNVWPEHNFMLILTGPENCRKTSFLSSLMPKAIASYMISNSVETLNSDKSVRDLKIQMASAALLIIDEFEIFYSKKNESLFKNLVTSAAVDYVPIYSKQSIVAKRTAALAGTTNKRKLPIEMDSSRRLAMLDVRFIDTDKVAKINWHAFYSQFVKVGKEAIKKKIYPWKLSQNEIYMQYEENEKFRASSDLEYILKEIYDFDKEFPGLHMIQTVQSNSEWLQSRSDVIAHIKQRYPTQPIKVSALENTLKMLCGKYTHTSRDMKEMPNCKAVIHRGVVKQNKYKKFFLPPKTTLFESEEI